MIEPFLKAQLEPVTLRQRSGRLWKSLALCWLGAALAGLPFLLLQSFTGASFPWAVPSIALGAILAAMGMIVRAALWEPDYRQMARDIERRHPDLHALLLTAVEQQPDPQTGQFSYLQRRVISEAVDESFRQDWNQAVSRGRLAGLQVLHLAALAGLLVVLTGFQGREQGVLTAFDPSTHLTVTPGDTTVEKGKGVVVMGRFEGQAPAEVTLEVMEANQETRRYPLVRSMEDPVFGGSIPEVSSDLNYRLVYGNQATRDFQISVFEYPRLEQADARLSFPDYTGEEPREIKDTRRISAVEGARLDLDLKLNKPVVQARLRPRKEGEALPLIVETNRAAVRLADYSMAASDTYSLELVDADGRTNRVPAQFVLHVVANQRPDLKLVAPRGDTRVSALEEVSFEAETSDDFGVVAYGVHYDLPDGESSDVELGTTVAAHEKHSFEHLLRLEALDAKPDQLIAWHFWADDMGPDGEVRRTFSDMYFSEVRPFEEIFREGAGGQQDSQQQEQQQGQQGAGDEAMNLADTQKEIIQATWKVIRRETGATRTREYGQDIEVLKDAQDKALAQARLMRENSTSLTVREALDEVEKHMTAASEELGQAADDTAPLPRALKAEQMSYQALLNLAAHEFQVTRSQNSQSQQSQRNQQRNQRQLDQLELKESENRYETERQASASQSPEQQEQLQVLNRLKELARRQEDLNERLKELQNALEEASTPEEEEEIRNRLKRLREEQQEILADVDELQQRMSRPENQTEMAESREQLEQTRSQVQEAAEALANEEVDEALSSGTRAERELEELRDEFRERSSSQFAEQMRRMRAEARDLARSEEEIQQQLRDMNQARSRSLTDADTNEELAQRLREQRAGVTNLLSNMRTVSEQSENVEPLLSRQLQDSYRETMQSSIMEDLEIAQELVERKFSEEAVPFEQRAGERINDLKSSVESAAESVLGDDVEALRLARRELEELAAQVEEEMRRSRPQLAGAENAAGLTNQFGVASSPRGDTNAPAGLSAAGDTNRLGQASGQPQDGQSGEGQQAQAGQRPSAGQQGEQAASDQQGEGQPAGTPQEGQGQQAAGGRQPGQESGGEQPGQQPGDQTGQQASNQQGGQQQSGQQGQPGEQPGGQQGGQQPGQQAGGQPQGQQGGQSGAQSSAQRGGLANNQSAQGGNFFDSPGGTGPGGNVGPLTGQEYRDWSDRLRNVEEIVEPPDLREDIARVSDSAREMRSEFKRHGAMPQWDLVETEIVEPLRRLQRRVNEELARRESNDALVPIDRDPVPARFSELVRRYYERLGTE